MLPAMRKPAIPVGAARRRKPPRRLERAYTRYDFPVPAVPSTIMRSGSPPFSKWCLTTSKQLRCRSLRESGATSRMSLTGPVPAAAFLALAIHFGPLSSSPWTSSALEAAQLWSASHLVSSSCSSLAAPLYRMFAPSIQSSGWSKSKPPSSSSSSVPSASRRALDSRPASMSPKRSSGRFGLAWTKVSHS